MIYPAEERVVVLDSGTAVGLGLLRTIRELGVFSEIMPLATEPQALQGVPTKGIVVVNTAAAPGAPRAIFNRQLLDLDLPVLMVGQGEPGGASAAAIPNPAELRQFLLDKCGCTPDWTPKRFVELAVPTIRRRLGAGQVVAGLSGGVDSSVAAALVHRAIGHRLTCLFVDNGLLRQNEAQKVPQLFTGLGWNVVGVDAAAEFHAVLRGITDPEEKRQRIGRQFFEVFAAQARQLGEIDFLLQGTLYPDVIESGSLTGQAIKTHHNVGDLPATMNLKLLEPLRFLFKDEVRRIGEALQLPAGLIWRQPFPGPGLAIRIMGEVTPQRLDILRQADAILHAEIQQAGLAREIWQFFAVLTGARAVGTNAGERFYGEALAIRAVTGSDAMTADWAPLPHEFLARLSQRLLHSVPGIARVVYDITAKPPGTIEWE